MKFRSSSVVILILALFISLPHFNKASFLFYACSRAAAYDLNINRDFCLTSLQADPKSVSANLTGLLHISINLAIKNTTRTASHIRYLLSNSAYAHLKDDLSFCQERYSEAIGCLYDAVNRISSSRSDYHNDANWALTGAIDEVDTCVDESNNKEILSKEHDNAFQLCAMALTFLNKDVFRRS